MRVTWLQFAGVLVLMPLTVNAGSLRVGPTRIDLSPRHPVATLEVENTGDTATLVQADALSWAQSADGESLDPTTELIATPLVLTLAPGETQRVRVGLREPNRTVAEHTYRVLVSEITPTFVASAGLRFAVRISVPLFATADETPAARAIDPSTLSWRVLSGNPGCDRVMVQNTSARHDHVLRATLLSAKGDVLWESDSPAYVLAGAQHAMHPQLCSQDVLSGAQLRLVTESRTLTLPPSVAGVLADAK